MTRRAITGLRGLVTGASGGIGAAIGRQLVRSGAQILLVARRREALAQVAHELADSPGQVDYLAGDITDPAVRAAARYALPLAEALGSQFEIRCGHP